MNSKQYGLIRFCVAVVLTLGVAVYLMSRGTTHVRAQGAQTPVHMTTDWSNRHMVYSAPSGMSQAWRLQAEPRYLHQWTRANAATLRPRGAR
jgi:hypothetical protein